jgi:hypothetical protein
MIEELRKTTAQTDTGPQSSEGWMSWPSRDGHICHFVPPGWEFPARITVRAAWDVWQFGDKNTGIRPYKLVSKEHDVNNQHQMRCYRFRAVMCELETIAKDNNIVPNTCKVHQLPAVEVDEFFARCFPLLVEKLYISGGKQRVEELSCGTVYNRVCAHHKSAQAP